MQPADLLSLPPDLPVPLDDGACGHLPGLAMPAIALRSTDGVDVRLDDPTAPRTIVFAYPRTGRPGEEPPGGTAAWNAIPGARGCTPQACAYRDHFAELTALDVRVFGLSTQDTAYQRELVDRMGLPYPILSDEHLALAAALRLPTFETEGLTLLRRQTLVIEGGRIEHVFYPVFPSDRDAEQVVEWLKARAGTPNGGTAPGA
ncbi:MAG: peroxiredoxin [Candidatus Limnocylindrales bacterium]